MFVDQTPAAFFGRNVRITTEILQMWFAQFNRTIDEFQEYLLTQTFDNPIFSSCSIRMKYQEGFLKTILKWMENDHPNATVHDRWYELIVDLASRDTSEQDWCHTVYLLSNGQSIIHRQSTATLSHGLTGLSSWPAAFCLGNYLMQQMNLLENKRVLELGAGSGLLGIALLKSSSEIPSYTLTDYSPMILNLLRQNILLNFPEDQLDNRIRIEALDWSEEIQSSFPSNSFDFLLATDVVYDPSIINDLVRTIESLMKTNPNCVAFLANAIRNPSTYEQFRCVLNRSSLTINSIVLDEKQSIELIQISQSFNKV